jgi:hypothetical protein
MLANTLNTNEVKNAAGTEVEFQHRRQEGQLHEWAQINETFNLPHRLIVSHREKGVGVAAVRSSAVIVSKTVIAADGITPVTIKGTLSLNIPVGKLSSSTETKNVLAEIMSFVASLGASTTILYDCSGNGAGALVDGGL